MIDCKREKGRNDAVQHEKIYTFLKFMISFRQFAKLKILTFACHGKKEKIANSK